MSRLTDDLRYIITGDQPEEDDEVEVEVELEDDCDFCGGLGLPTSFCPVCGKWDIRSPDEIEDGNPDDEFIIA